jgi:2-keto-4-pentenoate hydratase/2-oxohepta-3-ene-1,7-dioic acid hydratase in catechol pathway
MSDYKLLSYETATGPQAGLLVNDRVYGLAALTGVAADGSLIGVMQDWSQARGRVAKAAEAAASQAAGGVPLDQVKLTAPLLYPTAIYCAGANYGDHMREMAKANNRPLGPDPKSSGLTPWFFLKPSSAIVADGAEVRLPRASKAIDWEVELAAVIGAPARDVSVDKALDYVAGYTIANDLSARDLSRRPPVPETSPFFFDWVAHKGFDGSCPLGPWIVPADQIADPQNLKLGLRVNGVVKQDSNTSEMIYNLAEQIAHLSSRRTLWPGEMVLTGTPAGVGAARGEFLKAGDSVEAWIEGIGTLHTQIKEPWPPVA